VFFGNRYSDRFFECPASFVYTWHISEPIVLKWELECGLERMPRKGTREGLTRAPTSHARDQRCVYYGQVGYSFVCYSREQRA
jgi:hypothetical protein